jgi:hypothetical protein
MEEREGSHVEKGADDLDELSRVRQRLNTVVGAGGAA